MQDRLRTDVKESVADAKRPGESESPASTSKPQPCASGCQNDRWKQWEKVEVSDGTPAPPASSPISRVSSSPWNILYSFTAFTKIAGEGQGTGRGCFQGLEAAETLQPTVPSVLEFQHWHRYSRTAPAPAHAPHHKPQLTINLRIFLMLITVVTTYIGHTVDEWRRRWRLAGPHQQHSCP